MTDPVIQGTGSISDLTGDFILYRSLNPLDTRLPRFEEIRRNLSLSPDRHPRKSDREYGRVSAAYIRLITKLEGKPEPSNLLFIGDTIYNDGAAFRNILHAGRWKGNAFIGSEDTDRPPEIITKNNVAAATRWQLLGRFLSEVDVPLDEHTVLVLDLDKTTLGARGRNDGPINKARMSAIRHTIQGTLDQDLDDAAFQHAYDTLNQPEFHPFTGDNQDYLAYLCLMLSGGVLQLDRLVSDIRSGRYKDFPELLQALQQESSSFNHPGLLKSHEQVWHAVQKGDPTPYKEFRKAEFAATLARFTTDSTLPLETILAEKIALTGEVYEAALELRNQGVTVLGISDKPDLSSIPDEEGQRDGILPVHKQQTIIVGV